MIKPSSGFEPPDEISFPEIPATLSSPRRDLASSAAPATRPRSSELHLDDFQVALVPSQLEVTGVGWTRTGDTRRIFLLPLTWRQLIAQVHHEVGRANAPVKAEVIRFGDVTVNLASMEVRRAKRLLKLTALEFKVLRFFLLHPNRVISRTELLDQVWGYENYPCTRTVDNHILKLRRLLEVDFAKPVYFRTVHCIGYKFVS